jgi:Tol biopolymer transport system component
MTTSTTTTIAYGFLLVGVGVAIIFASSIFMLPPLPNQFAYGSTFPGENGKIAFARTIEGGRWEIFVMNADGTGETRLTNNPAFDGHPDWSPDGEKIAFERDFDEIYVMNAADGSGQTRLTTGEAPSWSPDGEKIAFARGDIYVMNADGTGETRLTNSPTFDGYPDWSPDGEKIAFTRTVGDNYEIFVMNADGTGQTRLTNNTGLIHDLHPSWSPDSEKIAFDSSRDVNDEIFVMNADGTGQTRLTRGATIDRYHWYPDWSPDGEKIAFTVSNDRTASNEIYVMNADGTGQTRLTGTSVTTSGGFHPSWSPPPPQEDTTPPILTVPEDMVVEATSEQGAEVTYTVTAQDNVDGNATLEEDGTTVTQDDVGGNITMSCDPPSGSVFPIGNTTVECTATDEAGNEGTESFTVTVNPLPSPPTPIPKQVIDELISTIQNLDDDNVPQSVKTSLIALLEEVSNILSDDNPNNDESACGTLDALINQVNANERSDTLTADEADELRTQAEDIMNQLDC